MVYSSSTALVFKSGGEQWLKLNGSMGCQWSLVRSAQHELEHAQVPTMFRGHTTVTTLYIDYATILQYP